MGVSGSGKSTVGNRLAKLLQLPFCEGDDLHSAENLDKMRAGAPLDDHDRAPWLARINDWLRSSEGGGVVACSALQRAYRERLRQGAPTLRFVLLDPPRELLAKRLAFRAGHFMPANLLNSQLEALERPEADEDALRLTGEPPDEAADAIAAWLGLFGP